MIDLLKTNLKKIMLVIGIIIVIVIILIVGMQLVKTQEDIKEEQDILDTGNLPITSQSKELVTSHSTFFSVGNAIQSYLNSISLDVEAAKSVSIPGTKMRSAASIYAKDKGITNESSKKETIYNCLSADYIRENNVTKDNVLEKVEVNQEVKYTPLKMIELIGENITRYAVYGIEKQVSDNEELVRGFIVNVDRNNNTFNIEPIDISKYNNLEDVPLEAEDKSIESNDSNYFNFTIMQDNEIAQKYFTYFKELLFNKPDEAFNLLDEEYRNKRFENVDSFKEYITKNSEEIKEYLAKEYEINTYEDSTEYICKDQYENVYSFNVASVMNFSVKLDTYTIESDEVKAEYQNADEQNKVQMNIDKWILMINNRDYKAAYNVLDEGFKQQYFQTLESFEDYMRDKFPYHYGLTFGDISKQSGIYIQEIYLTDITGKKKFSPIKETIFMQLTDDGFNMSFRRIGK